jgi:hypothetical protein
MTNLKFDKLTEEYSFRIPDITKRLLDRCSKAQRKSINECLLVTIAECLHKFKFDPLRYLVEDYNSRNVESR